MFSPKGDNLERGWPGRVDGDRVVQLAAQTLQSFFTGGGQAREHAEYPLAEVDLRPPVLHPPSVRDFYAFEQHVKTARGAAGPGDGAGVVRDPGLLLLEPGGDLRPRGRRSRTRRERRARLRARGGGRDRRRRPDRRLHDPERLVRARPPAAGDEDRPRPGEGQGLRDEPRPGARHARRARRPAARDGRARERRGALAREPGGHAPLVGRDRRARRRATRGSGPGTSSARGRSARAASSSTATGAGSSRATSSSSRSRGSACCGTGSARSGPRLLYPSRMPTYQRRGEVPRKRHIQFRDNGTLLTEEVMGLEGFSGTSRSSTTCISPCRVKELGAFEPIEREEWVPGRARAPALQDHGDRARGRRGLRPQAPDVEQRRRDLALPPERDDGLLLPERRGRRGRTSSTRAAGTLHTTFGDLPYRDGDYVVIPRGTTYRFEPSGPAALPASSSRPA